MQSLHDLSGCERGCLDSFSAQYHSMDFRHPCTMTFAGVEPWPEDVKLYQPFEVEQILLPDNAACLSVKAFLRMCKLNFQIEMRTNAESMSPSGSVPFIRCGTFVVADVEPIINFVHSKGINLSAHLDHAGIADMKAYISLVNIVLRNAELYISWCDKPTLNEVTKPRYGSSLPWPVNHILCWQTKYEVKKKLKTADWQSKSLEEVYEEVNNCCHALSEKLGSQKFFFGDTPTELDAVVFGHLFAILTTPLPDNRLCSILREYQNLVNLCHHIDVQYFQKHADEDDDIENIEMETFTLIMQKTKRPIVT
ncbi:metaxin-2-like isoform X3 [Stegodyphus dumicola]|uniref:metaxin-2-like isoform X3 n=1 Tax=Stegodyphus dumicola TaxID=202533 RepID=UPI0015A8734D|nr:metaxin-2-like isoform X3 [Stegodyphus dumicola]